MMLAVAGVDQKAIAEQCQQLAGGDWSGFSPEERTAFAFARKQAENPSSVTAEDVQALVDHFGRERAMDVVWWMCRCHYMIRVADAFQLPLERDNVFDGFAPAREAVAEP